MLNTSIRNMGHLQRRRSLRDPKQSLSKLSKNERFESSRDKASAEKSVSKLHQTLKLKSSQEHQVKIQASSSP